MQNAEEFVKTSIYPIIAARDAEWQERMDRAFESAIEAARTEWFRDTSTICFERISQAIKARALAESEAAHE